MEELQQLVRLIERKGKLPGPHLLNFADNESLETKLYYFLKDNKACDESKVIKHLYSSDGKRDAFKMLKSRFRKKLFNQLNFLNLTSLSGENRLAEIEIYCNKLLSEVTVLVKMSSRPLAEKQVLKVLKIAQQAHLTKHIIEALELYFEIAIFYKSKKKSYDIKAELEKQYKILEYEREANIIYRISVAENRANVNSRENYLTQLKENVNRLKILWEESRNSLVYSRYHYLKMIYLESIGNYSLQIKFIKEDQQAFLDGLINPFYFKNIYNSFILVYAYLRCGRLEEGLNEAEKVNQLVNSGVPNWFANNENYFFLTMYSKKYDKAGEILNVVLSHNYFKNLSPIEKERWFIYTKFYQLIVDKGANSLISRNTKELIQDKKGFNIWIIILEFLTLLKEGKYELLTLEAERIRKYISKHLDSKSDPRNKYFLKLLLLIVKEEFDLEKCRQKSRYLYNKLSQTPPAGDAYAEVEVVPFEHLWDFILETLSKNKRMLLNINLK